MFKKEKLVLLNFNKEKKLKKKANIKAFLEV